MELTERQQAFIDHMARVGNASEAARLSGYSVKTAAQIGSRLLRDSNIQRAIDAKKHDLMRRIEGDHIEKARKLTKKEVYRGETLRNFEAIPDEKSSTKQRYWDQIGRMEGHYGESEQAPAFSKPDGTAMTVQEIMANVGKLTGVLREIRFEADLIQKQKGGEGK